MKHGRYHRRSRHLWGTCCDSFSSRRRTVREFCWQNLWHQEPQKRQRFIVKRWISFWGRTKQIAWMLTKDVLLHDNVRPHTAACTNALIKLFNWEIFNRPSYKRLPSLHHDEGWLATQRFHTNKELVDGVNNWLQNLAAPFCDERLQKLVSWYKCLNVDGNYVMQLCMQLFHVIKFCSLFSIFLTSQLEVDFGIGSVHTQPTYIRVCLYGALRYLRALFVLWLLSDSVAAVVLLHFVSLTCYFVAVCRQILM
jgi:hypothetical protein